MLSFNWEGHKALHPTEELPLQLPVQGKGGGGGCYLSTEKATRLSTLQKSFLFNCQCKVRGLGVDFIFLLRRPKGSPPCRRASSSTVSARYGGWGWILSFYWEDQEALHPAEELPLQLPVQGTGGGDGCYLSIEKTKSLKKSFLFNCQCKVKGVGWGWMLPFLWEDQEALHPAEELPLQLPVQGKGCVEVRRLGVDDIFLLRRPQGSLPCRRASSSTASAR